MLYLFQNIKECSMQIFKCCGNTKAMAQNSLLQFFNNEKNKELNHIFVLPNSGFENLKNEIIKNFVSGALFNFDIIKFSELKKFIKIPENKIKIKSIDGCFIVKKILEENKQKLKCFSLATITLTFAKLVYEVVVKLKSNKVCVFDFFNEINCVKNESAKNKLYDICFIYEAYQDVLIKQNFFDEIDEQIMVATQLSNCNNLLNTNFYFCFFDDFTKQEMDVVNSVVEASNATAFSVVLEKENQSNADLYDGRLNIKIDKIAKKMGIKTQNNYVNYEKNAIKMQICENLFALSSNLQPKNLNGEITLLKADDMEGELQYVAKQIVWLIKNNLCRYSDILICLPDKNIYEPIFKNVFDKFDISYYASFQNCIEKTNCFKLIIDSINCIKSNFLTKYMLNILYNPAYGVDITQREFVETIVAKYGIENEMWLQPVFNKSEKETFNKFEIFKTGFTHPLLELKKDFSTSTTVQDFCNAIKQFLVAVNAEENLKKFETKKIDKTLTINNSSSFSVRLIVDNLDSACENMAQTNITLTEFVSILTDVIGKKKMPVLGQQLDSVFVSDVNEICGLNRKYLFVVGASDGVFPASENDVGILSDSEILSLNCLNGITTVLQKNMHKKFMVLQSLLCGDELFVSYSLNGLSEKHFPSTVFDGLQNLFCFNEKELPVVKIEDLLADSNAFGSDENRLCFNIATYKNALDFFALEDCKQAFDVMSDLFFEFGVDVKNVLNFDTVQQYITKAKQLFFPNDTTKVSQLESYFMCPFKHFVDYGLKLSEKEKSKIKANEIGDILHAVAERFVKENNKKTLKNDEILQISEKIFANVVSKPEFEHLLLDNKNKTILLGLKTESYNVCNTIYYQSNHSQFVTKFCEAVFGDNNFASMASLKANGYKLLLKGKVDRVDLLDNYVRVVDYKTGRNSAEYKTLNLYNGKKVQLFVYMWAILKGIKNLELQPAGVFLMPLHNEWTNVKTVSNFEKYKLDGTTLNEEFVLKAQDDQVCLEHPKSDIINFSISTSKKNANDFVPNNRSGNLVSLKKFNEMINYSVLVCENAIKEILNGYIKAKPFEGSCAFCSAKSFCEFARQTVKKVRNEKFKIDEKTFSGEEDEKNDSTAKSD